jgi:hypothetical protein
MVTLISGKETRVDADLKKKEKKHDKYPASMSSDIPGEVMR